MKVGQWFGLLFVLAIVYVLVRPRSGAAQLVSAFGTFGTAVVRRATDIGNT